VTQNEKIWAYLQKYRSITPLEAYLDIGTLRLGARIFDLRSEGRNIKKRNKTVRNRFGNQVTVAEYYLAEPVQAQTTLL
jgi:hypothetical protein